MPDPNPPPPPADTEGCATPPPFKFLEIRKRLYLDQNMLHNAQFKALELKIYRVRMLPDPFKALKSLVYGLAPPSVKSWIRLYDIYNINHSH